MRSTLIQDPGRAYMVGIITAFLGLFFGYLWSPDYFELVNNGYNFLYIACFIMFLFIITLTIDLCFKDKHNAKRGKNE